MFLPALLLTVLLALVSLFVGVRDVSPFDLFSGAADQRDLMVLLASRVPRTIALVLAGSGMAIAGTIMQMLARNRFVEPSTAGTVESAGLGMLTVLLIAPDMPVIAKMLVAAAFSMAGTALFLSILRAIPLRSILMVPLVGIMLGGMISAVTTFFAYRFDLLQSMGAWASGDFSVVLRGRYEILWVAFALTIAAYVAADRFTVAGMGEAFSSNLGLNYRKVMTLGLIIVSMVTACVVVTAGVVPFLGLIVPNVVSMIMGDNLRRSLPWIGLCGAALVLVCDIIGRVINAPFEIPVGAVLGIVGSLFFLYLLIGRRNRVA
ncbi:iron chelate uptake ABC transporter family permease subunit [Rhizobiales bacterium RZME27]|uniref:Iron chelate uptake ABC transporter family permease subunit n=1 Tax=Endobacterium cereale TaxID=2663029 RepID=A0A6A8AD55_9HYPH|nr:ABC transporter permease [Endobacterium cereale]MEB2844263.1 ABC transporter permease [Endobacterium cereale]MQY48674.1 iron chelate uptake ABC transporter family permease subunit [Endobacterium cereale]